MITETTERPTAAELMQKHRQEVFARHKEFIEDIDRRLSNRVTSREEEIGIATDNLIFNYFCFPYFEMCITWKCDNFPSADEEFSAVTPFNLTDNIVFTYVFSALGQNISTELSKKHREHPEQAEKPLTDSETELFTSYLEDVIKPALTEILGDIRAGKYRTLSEIEEEIIKTFPDTKIKDIFADEEKRNIFLSISNVQYRPRNDFNDILVKYAKLSGFSDRIHKKTAFKIEEVFEVSKLEMPLDKVNRKIWNFPISPSEPLTFAMESKADKRKGRELDAAYSIDFSALEENGNVKITKKLTPFDKRVYAAISAIYNAGNTVISLTQIYFAMGNTSRPPKASLENIYNSIIKMLKAYITLDNEDEAKSYNYPHFKYEGNLLPIEMLSNVDIKGKITESAIHIFREPPLISFAKGHGNQLTTVPIKLLQSPISKTEANLMLEDYLIYRIAKAKPGKDKKPKLSNIIKLDTLYEKMGITDRRAKPRLLEKVVRYLDYYKKVEYIVDYKITKEEIILEFKKSESEEKDEETATA